MCSICGRDIDAETRRARRLTEALLSNMDSWLVSLSEIEENSGPGSKHLSLHLLRNMTMAKQALERLSEDA